MSPSLLFSLVFFVLSFVALAGHLDGLNIVSHSLMVLESHTIPLRMQAFNRIFSSSLLASHHYLEVEFITQLLLISRRLMNFFVQDTCASTSIEPTSVTAVTASSRSQTARASDDARRLKATAIAWLPMYIRRSV